MRVLRRRALRVRGAAVQHASVSVRTTVRRPLRLDLPVTTPPSTIRRVSRVVVYFAALVLVRAVFACGGTTTTDSLSHFDHSPGSGGSAGGFDGTTLDGSSAGHAGLGGSNQGGAAGGECACPRTVCLPGSRSVLAPGACCPTCVPCGPVNCPAIPTCGAGEQPFTPPGQCCPTSCGPTAESDAGACLGLPCADSHACLCNSGFGIACSARSTCEVCSVNGLNDPCLGRPASSPEGPDCCPGLTCVNNRCVP
jgi:hypothetical protein